MRFSAVSTISAAVLAAIFLSGCNTPKGVGQARSILKGADEQGADFQVVYVTKSSLSQVTGWPRTGAAAAPGQGWIRRSRGPSEALINAGDRIDLTIWETGDVTLLSAPGQKIVALPGLQVSPDGTIFLPYIDKVYIGNMTADQAREAVQAKLEPVIPSAQVLISHLPGRKSTVDLVSGVTAPGTYPLPGRDFTLLSLLAQGGGVPQAMANPYVKLMREGKLYSISADRLLKDPALDTTLRGGDKVWIENDERYFIVLGSSGREAQMPFTQDRVSVIEALSQSGGLNEYRADARGVLVLRAYPEKALRGDGSGPDKRRVIFAFDLTTADGLFSAGEFFIADKDLVVVAENPIGSAASILGLATAALGLGRTAQVIAE